MIIKHRIKIIVGIGAIIVLSLAYFSFFSYPHSVKSFGPLRLGDQAPTVSENVVEYKFLYTLKYKFYIYAMEKNMSYCALGDCGMSGVLVDCMGGWLSADGLSGEGGANDYGLIEEEVAAGKSSIIVIADEDRKIVGIYPNYQIKNIPYILKNYRSMFNDFDFCYDTQMPRKF